MNELRIAASSAGVAPASLAQGRDLVLAADPAHVLVLPEGTLADDFLDASARVEVDLTSLAVREAWHEAMRERMTLAGVCLPWVWSLELLAGAVLPAIHLAEATRRAIAAARPSRVTLSGLDAADRALVEAVAADEDVESTVEATSATPTRSETRAPLRRRVVASAARIGLPSLVHRGGTLVFGYWHLAPLIERMVAQGPAPVVSARALPPNPRRTLRAAARGGVVGSPSPLLRRRARTLVAPTLRELETPALPGLSARAARCVSDRLAKFARDRAPGDVADTLFWRQLLRRGRIEAVVVPNDVVPELRLVVTLAQEVGIPTLVVQHGVYLPPTPGLRARPIDDRVGDLETADEVAAWSSLTAAALPRSDRDVHVVGYPLPHTALALKGPADPQRPRVLVLVQGPERITSTVPQRMIGVHCEVATRATLRAFPEATITLRPHPSHDLRAVEAARACFPGASVSIDGATDILELVDRHDVCIGSNSTAVYQAAAAGCAVVVLNLTGFDWKWPLAGETPVPVVASVDELEAALRTAAAEPSLAAHEILVEALGAGGGDGSARLVEVVRTLPERRRRASSAGR